MKDASIVDPFWGPSFVLVAWTAYAVADQIPEAGGCLVRGSGHRCGDCASGSYLAFRNLGHGEDFRYVAMRGGGVPAFWIVSLFTVFLLQAALAWIVSLPVQVAMVDGGRPGWLAFAGIGGLGGRPVLRDGRRSPIGPLQARPRLRGQGHGPGLVALHPPPQLLRGLHRVVGSLPGGGRRLEFGVDDHRAAA